MRRITTIQISVTIRNIMTSGGKVIFVAGIRPVKRNRMNGSTTIGNRIPHNIDSKVTVCQKLHLMYLRLIH